MKVLRHSPEPVLVLRRVYVGGPITALAAASPRRKVRILGSRTSGPFGGRKEGPKGCNGSVNPLALRQCGTITEPFTSRGRDVVSFISVEASGLASLAWRLVA